MITYVQLSAAGSCETVRRACGQVAYNFLVLAMLSAQSPVKPLKPKNTPKEETIQIDILANMFYLKKIVISPHEIKKVTENTVLENSHHVRKMVKYKIRTTTLLFVSGYSTSFLEFFSGIILSCTIKKNLENLMVQTVIILGGLGQKLEFHLKLRLLPDFGQNLRIPLLC